MNHADVKSTTPTLQEWVIWVVSSNRAVAIEAARLVARDCQTRHIHARVLEFTGSDDEDRNALNAGGPVIVVSLTLPSAGLQPERLILAAEAPITAPARTVVAISAAATASDIALSLLTALEEAGWAPAASEVVYSPEEEERLRKALDDLGYL